MPMPSSSRTVALPSTTRAEFLSSGQSSIGSSLPHSTAPRRINRAVRPRPVDQSSPTMIRRMETAPTWASLWPTQHHRKLHLGLDNPGSPHRPGVCRTPSFRWFLVHLLELRHSAVQPRGAMPIAA